MENAELVDREVLCVVVHVGRNGFAFVRTRRSKFNAMVDAEEIKKVWSHGVRFGDTFVGDLYLIPDYQLRDGRVQDSYRVANLRECTEVEWDSR